MKEKKNNINETSNVKKIVLNTNRYTEKKRKRKQKTMREKKVQENLKNFE
jgi:hypothetical protein